MHGAFRQEVGQAAEIESAIGKACRTLEKRAPDVLQPSIEELRGSAESYARSLERVIEEHGRAKTRSNGDGLAKVLVGGLKGGGASQADGFAVMTTAQLQKLLHVSIASYGSLRAWSREIGDEDGEILFDRLVEERKRADRRLTEVALELLAEMPRGGSNGRESSRVGR